MAVNWDIFQTGKYETYYQSEPNFNCSKLSKNFDVVIIVIKKQSQIDCVNKTRMWVIAASLLMMHGF